MPTKKDRGNTAGGASAANISSSLEDLLLAALERGGDSLETGRYLVTFKQGAVKEGIQYLKEGKSEHKPVGGMRVADAREFNNSAATFESVGDADAVVLPEIGVAIIGGEPARERSMMAFGTASDNPFESIEPERFIFSDSFFAAYGQNLQLQQESYQSNEGNPGEELLRVSRLLEMIAEFGYGARQPQMQVGEEAMALGATWGLTSCRVPQSARSGAGIKVAILDTGMDLGHPDFVGRQIVGETFVGQPVQDLNGHGTHCIGTSCGPLAPSGNTPRYGIAYRSSIYAGKVLRNDGWSVDGSVLAGMEWAITQRCEVISMSLSGSGGPYTVYTDAGQKALDLGLLMIAAAGNEYGIPAGAPANSPTIMSVASLDQNLRPSDFSNRGKIDIAAPGRNILSSWFRPRRYNTISGTSMAAPHVAGIAALLAESSTNLRGLALKSRLQQTVQRLPNLPATQIGAGLVQAS